MRSTSFGHSLAYEFERETSGKRLREVALFRALMRSFGKLKPAFPAEEYHGVKSKVEFDGATTWTKAVDRCELSDLAIIWLDGQECRVTFLQAKWSKETYSCCSAIDSVNECFDGNSVQWYLLNKRPLIRPAHSKFRPPPNLLRDALLPSVGSYGVFHEIAPNVYGFLYASADVVACPRPIKPRARTSMEMLSAVRRQLTAGDVEEKWSCCLSYFGAALFRGHIGTPLTLGSNVDISELAYRRAVGGWLAGTLKKLASKKEMGELASWFVSNFGEFQAEQDPDDEPGVGRVLLIGGENSMEREGPQSPLIGSLDF